MNYNLSNAEIAEANIELASTYLNKANAALEKERKIKNLLVAKGSIEKALTLLDD